MTWLRNTWYAAAWSSEIGSSPFGRTLLNEPIVFYRTEAGPVAAIGGRCPHRFAPLSMGRVVSDCIECPYHGLRFGADGVCAYNPHGDHRIPKMARVKAYAVEERWNIIWVWGGDPSIADATAIPDLSTLDRPDLAHVRGYMEMRAEYQLGIDNLVDLSHAQFVHGDRLASSRFQDAQVTVDQQGSNVFNRLFIPRSDVPPSHRDKYPSSVTEVDYWLDSRWQPPSVVTNHVGTTLSGHNRDEGIQSFGTHIVTPETEHTSHYFYCHSRNYGVDDAHTDEKIREWQRIGFGQQDKPIIEAVAKMMGSETDPLKMRPVLLSTDVGAVRVRRVLAKLILEEGKHTRSVGVNMGESLVLDAENAREAKND